MSEKVYLAVDLGASSGRVVAGLFDGDRLRMEDVHRFENGPVPAAGKTYWDLLALWSHVQNGLRIAGERYLHEIQSVGVDTWGVDFALLGRGDELLANPRHYRDRHTDGIMPRAFAKVSRHEIFAESGLQFMQFNTLYQLYAMRLANSPVLEAAQTFLMIPDLFHWLLTGAKANEATNASTTQFFDPQRQAWAKGLLARFDIPTKILGELISPGTLLGPLLPDVAAATNLAGVQVVAPGTHDTASAVMAVPAASKPGAMPDWCYISLGTWALMGVESPQPVVNDLCQHLNFTNEGGVGGTTRLLKNITGMWLVQECRRAWGLAGFQFTWDTLNRMAEEAEPRLAFIDPDHASFTAPADMPKTIRDYCRRTGQPVPESEGAVIRCAVESLALKCRQVLSWLEQLTGGRLETIHIVGGGTQNRQLCQTIAQACGRRVLAGPIEATATGNLMLQAVTSGEIASVAQAREVIRRSFAVAEYEPRDEAEWDTAYGRFLQVCARGGGA